jgi:hypothetical protein
MHPQYTHVVVLLTFQNLDRPNLAATRHYKHCECNPVYFSWVLKNLVWAAWGCLCNTETCRTVNETLRLFTLCVHLVPSVNENKLYFQSYDAKLTITLFENYTVLNTKWPGAKFPDEIQGQVVYTLQPAINGRLMTVAPAAVLKHR